MARPSHPASPWEQKLFEQSRNPQPRKSRPPFTMILPASAQVPTPNREFLLTTPSEGVSYVATTAQNAGWDVELVDMRLGVSAEDAAARAVARGGVVAMPTFADSFNHNEKVLELVKQAAPQMTTIIGGSLISSLPDPLLHHLKADYAVLHEGELTLLELLEHLEKGGTPAGATGIPGLAMKLDGKIHLTPDRPQVGDLDALPIPDLFLYPSVKKDARVPELGLTTARGCYARCSFCFVNIRKMHFKGAERVREELTELKTKHGLEYIYVNDLTFTADIKRTWKIAEVLREVGITWSCSTRVEKAPMDLLKHMHACGCRDIWYGVESLDQKVLDLNHKAQTVEDTRRAVMDTMAAGIKVAANFIIGLPGESEASLDAMFRFTEEMNITPASVKYLSPFPGTVIYDEAVRRGLITDPVAYLRELAVRKVNDENDRIYNLTELPEKTLRDAFKRMVAFRARRVAENFPAGVRTGVAAAG